jgi:hypothetical protein
MAFTTLMVMPTPDEFEDPFFATMNNAGGYFETVDQWVQALREDADIRIAEDGAPWTVDVGTSTVAWGSNIVLRSGTNGGTITVNAGSIVCPTPGLLYVTLAARPLAAPIVLPMAAASTKTALAINEIVVGIRQGSAAMLRNLVATHVPNIYSFAGNPNLNVTASKVGDQCVDTVNSLTYVAYAADNSHWQIG